MSCTIVKSFSAFRNEGGIVITAEIGSSNCETPRGDISYDSQNFKFETVEDARKFFSPYFEDGWFARGFYSAYDWKIDHRPDNRKLTYDEPLDAKTMFENAILTISENAG